MENISCLVAAQRSSVMGGSLRTRDAVFRTKKLPALQKLARRQSPYHQGPVRLPYSNPIIKNPVIWSSLVTLCLCERFRCLMPILCLLRIQLAEANEFPGSLLRTQEPIPTDISRTPSNYIKICFWYSDSLRVPQPQSHLQYSAANCSLRIISLRDLHPLVYCISLISLRLWNTKGITS